MSTPPADDLSGLTRGSFLRAGAGAGLLMLLPASPAWANALSSAGTGATTLDFFMGPYSGSTKATFRKFTSDFTRSNPDLAINFQTAPWDAYDQKITTLIQAGNAPDLAMEYHFGDFQADGLLRPIREWATPKLRSDIVPAFLRVGNGYALPELASTTALFLNQRLLREAGIANKRPKTWDELEVAARTLKRSLPGVAPLGFPATSEDADGSFIYFLFGAGGNLVDAQGNWVFNSRKGIQAGNFIKRLFDAELLEPEALTVRRDDQQKRFLGGKTAMLIVGSHFIPQLQTAKVAYRVVPIPVKSGNRQFTLGTVDYFLAFEQSGDAQTGAIRKLASAVYEPKFYASWCAREGFLPVTKSAQGTFARKAPALVPFLAALPGARFAPQEDVRFARARLILIKAVQEILLSKSSVKEALDRAAEACNKLPRA